MKINPKTPGISGVFAMLKRTDQRPPAPVGKNEMKRRQGPQPLRPPTAEPVPNRPAQLAMQLEQTHAAERDREYLERANAIMQRLQRWDDAINAGLLPVRRAIIRALTPRPAAPAAMI
jgi:hypothetical protein